MCRKNTDTCKKEQAGGGGKWLQPTLNTTDNSVFACGRRFPNKGPLPWIMAIKHGNYTMFPGITAKAVNKHFPESVETQKGHKKKLQQNLRFTKQKLILDEPAEDVELTQAIAKQNISFKVVNAQETVYSDQTGRLPMQSSQGNTSLMVYFNVDANYINAEPIQNHKDNQMIQAYQNLWTRTNRNCKTMPNMHILDNEASEAFKTEIKKNATCNWYLQTLTAEIWQKEQLKLSRAISLQYWPVSTHRFQ
jgi:hypothetical protein